MSDVTLLCVAGVGCGWCISFVVAGVVWAWEQLIELVEAIL